MHLRHPHLLVALVLATAACTRGGGSSLTAPPVLPGQVDLSVAKAVDDARPGEGQELVFTIAVANSGQGSAATGVHASDLLPAGLSFVSAAPGQGTYDAPTGLWTIGDLASGASTGLELRASVDAGTEGSTIENRVDGLAADQVDPNAANDADAASVTVVATVDLAVAKQVDVAAPVEGETIVYTVEVAHVAGSVDASGIAVLDPLPLGIEYVSHTLALGTYEPTTGRWSGFSLAPGAQAELAITAKVGLGTGGTSIVNGAALGQLDQHDSDAANDASTATIAVSDATNLALTKIVSDALPHEGGDVRFTISLVNEGPALASDVVVSDLLPAGVTYQFHTSDVGGYDQTTGAWSIPALAPGPTVVKLEIDAEVDAGTGGKTLVNTATLTALDQTDTQPGDDSASAALFVDPNADLALALVVDDANPARLQPVVLTLTLSNAPLGARATGVLVSVPLPAGLTHIDHLAGAGSYDPASGLWTVGAVEAGQSLALAIVVSAEVGTGGQALDVVAALAAADQPDPNAANGVASVALSVDFELVEILRDAFGVPHVFAQSDQGACYGAGYATAENRLSHMLWNRLVATGRIAEFFGRGAGDEFLESDRKVRRYGFARHAKKAGALLDPELRSLLDSYAAGANAYMASPNAVLHPVFAQAGVPLEPWTAEDCIAVWNELGRSFSQSELNEAETLHEFEARVALLGGNVTLALDQLIVPAVLDDSAAVVKQSDVPAGVQQAMEDYASLVGMGSVPLVAGGPAPKFSHAWAVTPDKTVDLKPLLVADPRIAIMRPNLLHEIHLRGATFEVRGAGPPGAFALLVGSTDAVAWGVTALALDQADLFRIRTDPVGHPGEYKVDGVFRPFEVDELETIAISGESPEPLNYCETIFGPIVTEFVKDVRPDEEFAVRSTLFYEPERVAAEGYLAMFRSGDVLEFGTALAALRFPSMNVLFADAGGRIGYWANGAAPARSVLSPVSAFGGRAALDGDLTANDWVGIVPHELMPWVLDPADDVLFSANHMPIGSWYPLRIGLAQGSTGETSRSRRLRELLVGASPLAASDVQRIRNDAVYTAARDVVRLALHARDDLNATFSPETMKALVELEPWLAAGARLRADVPGVLVAANVQDTFRPDAAGPLIPIYGGGSGGAHKFFKARIAELEASGTAALTPDEIHYLDLTIAKAMTDVDAFAGPPSTWLATFTADVLTIDVPAWTDLAGFQSLDPLDVLQVGPLTAVGPAILGSQPQETYAQHVRVGASDETLSLLPFGEGEPGSAHATDQLGLLEAQTLRPSPTSHTAIEALGAFSSETIVF